jgi:hypothetical protein
MPPSHGPHLAPVAPDPDTFGFTVPEALAIVRAARLRLMDDLTLAEQRGRFAYVFDALITADLALQPWSPEEDGERDAA